MRLARVGLRGAALLGFVLARAATAQQGAAPVASAPADRLAEAQRREAQGDLAERAAALAPLPAPVFAPPAAAQQPAVPAPAPAAAASAQPAPPSEEQRYNTALALIQARSLPAAREAFTEFTRLFPGSRLLPNAAFWQAEIDFLEERWDVARNGFLGVTEKFSQHPKAADSLYKSALCSLKLNDKQTAIGQLNEVLRRFPASEAAILAEKKLAELTKRT